MMKTGQVVLTLLSDMRRLCKAMVGFKREVREFTCGNCGDRFNSARPDVEAICEMETVFGDLPASERAIVCQTCWDKMKALGIVHVRWYSPAEKVTGISPKRLSEQQQQEQVDDDYERSERSVKATNPTGGGDYFT